MRPSSTTAARSQRPGAVCTAHIEIVASPSRRRRASRPMAKQRRRRHTGRSLRRLRNRQQRRFDLLRVRQFPGRRRDRQTGTTDVVRQGYGDVRPTATAGAISARSIRRLQSSGSNLTSRNQRALQVFVRSVPVRRARVRPTPSSWPCPFGDEGDGSSSSRTVPRASSISADGPSSCSPAMPTIPPVRT